MSGASEGAQSGDVDLEKPSQEPLSAAAGIRKHVAKTYGSFPHDDPKFEDSGDDVIIDSMTYTMAWLKTWSVLTTIRGTVWEHMGIWYVMLRLMTLSFVVAVLAYNFLPNPGLLDTSNFGSIVAVMSLFVSLMLSFFLSSSVTRWLKCVDGFEQIFNSVRVMSMQLHALGANREHADLILRYALMSAHFLAYDMASIKLSHSKKELCTSRMWAKYENASGKYSHITTRERELLEKHPGDKPSQMWLWISTLLGRMAMDGEIPGMATPTYGRIMNIAQMGQEGLRSVRTAIVVQMPFLYVHLLAVLVHIECILMAINLGLSVGVAYHGIRLYVDHYYYKVDDGLSDASVTPLTTQLQTLLIECVKGFVGPLLYQAFFDIGVAISSPFSSPDVVVPLDRIIDHIEQDLSASNGLVDDLLWERPTFKAK